LWFVRGRFQAAAEEYRLALACKPDYADAHFNLALALAELGEMEEARRHYLRAVKLNPSLPQTRGHKGL
jgi:Flp pilus assembly protein TadD